MYKMELDSRAFVNLKVGLILVGIGSEDRQDIFNIVI
jgi:hypothetical protein